jgi:pimeloyl-ACP methyl ester carboxylesterase
VDFDVTARACLEHDASDVLHEVPAPSLVLGGTDDPFFDADTYRATAAALGAEWARFDGAGHGAIWRRSFLRDLVAFLADA